MFKFETIVKMVICYSIAFGAFMAAGDTKTPPPSNSNNYSTDNGVAAKAYEDFKAAGCLKLDQDKLTTECKNIKKIWDEKASSNSTGDCHDAATKYSTAKSELSTACGDANLSGSGKPGDVSCGFAVATCECANKGVTKVGKLDCPDNGDDTTTSSDSKTKNVPGLKDISVLKRNYAYCPARATQDYDQLKKDFDKSHDKEKELQDKLPQLMDDANKAKSDARENMDKIQQDAEKSQSKYQEDLAKAQKDKSDAQKQIMQQIAQMQQQAQTIDEQVGQFELAKSEAAMKRDETKKQIDLNCHASATATVSKRQSDTLDKLANGTLRLGGQRDILKRVGMSDFQAWQKLATYYYNICINSYPTLASKDSANRIYDAAVAQATKSQENAKIRKQAILDQIKQLKDPNGQCGQVVQQQDGSSNETDMCRASREAAQTQVRLGQAFATEQAGFQRQMANAQQSASETYTSKMQQYQMAANNLAEEKTRRTNLEQALNLADNAGASDGGDNKAYTKVRTKYSDFIGAGHMLLGCTDICPPVATLAEAKGNCREITDFLTQIEENFVSPQLHNDVAAPSTSAPSSSTTPTSADPAKDTTPTKTPDPTGSTQK